MAEYTVEIPDPIAETVVEKRADDFDMSPEQYLTRELMIMLPSCDYDRSKWISPDAANKDNTVKYDREKGN